MDVFEPLVRRAKDLYSLPSVAVDVLELTSRPDIDVRALKDCIERDPALVAKILKVVNSSLFGMSCEVVDLNQALALLGTKTLKLLVLGFNLPDMLFAEVAAEQLARYWAMSLSRAVAAREIAQSLWASDGDDAFIAGLLEDIGVLVLLKELGEPYARLLDGVWCEEADLVPVEREALGFDHRQLSAALFADWGLPQIIIDAIRAPRDRVALVRLDEPHAMLARILHLASLTAELVGRHRLRVLPDLLEAGDAYVHLDKPQLDALIQQLDPKVRALGDVLSLQMPEDLDFHQVVAEAHRQMSAVAEEVSVPLARLERCEEQLGEKILADLQELSEATSKLAREGGSRRSAKGKGPDRNAGGSSEGDSDRRFHAASGPADRQERGWDDLLVASLEAAVAQARVRREPVSLLILRSGPAHRHDDSTTSSDAGSALGDACQVLELDGGITVSSSDRRRVLVLPAVDRAAAVSQTYHALRRLVVTTSSGDAADTAPLCGGIASIAAVSKNFDACRLIDAAERCLYAAGQSGPGSVKSIELY